MPVPGWLCFRRVMVAPLIDREQVFKEADRLFGSGERPTIARVYERIGRVGSFSTISRFLKEWRSERQLSRADRPLGSGDRLEVNGRSFDFDSLPDELSRSAGLLLKALWEVAQGEAEQLIEVVRSESQAAVAEAQGEAEAALNQVVNIEQHVAQLNEQGDTLRSELMAERVARAAVEGEREQLSRALSELRASFGEQGERLKESLQESERVRAKSEVVCGERDRLKEEVALESWALKTCESELTRLQEELTSVTNEREKLEFELKLLREQQLQLLSQMNQREDFAREILEQINSSFNQLAERKAAGEE